MPKYLTIACIIALLLTACAGEPRNRTTFAPLPPEPPQAAVHPTSPATPLMPLPPTAAAVRPAAAPTADSHMLLAVDGLVEIQRLRWSNGAFDPAYPGLLLAGDDKLRVDATSKAYVLCSDLTIVLVQGAEPALNTVCPAGNRITAVRDGVAMPAARPGAVPYILLPSNTALRAAPSTLRWRDTHNAPYQVRIKAVETGDLVRPSASAAQTMLALDSPPNLAAGTLYRIEVTDTIGTSSLDPGLESTQTFWLLTAEELATLAGEEQRLRQQIDMQQLPPSPALLLGRAYIYLSHQLRADIVAQIGESGSTDPAVLLMLAQAYAEMYLDREAEPAYTAAAQALTAEPSRWRRITINLGLTHAFVLAGKRAEAVDCLQKARALATQLADTELIAAIDAYVPNLASPPTPTLCLP